MVSSITPPPLYGPQIILFTLPHLVFSEYRSRSWNGVVLFKMLSSISFLIEPLLSLSSESSSYHVAITTGLAFSLVGDYLLLPSREAFSNPRPATKEKQISTSFQAGILAFAIAHVAYIAAFIRKPETDAVSYPALTTTFVATMILAKWLGVIYPPSTPHLLTWENILGLSISNDMKPLVLGYTMIISTMLGVAVATSTAPVGGWVSQRVVGALMFVASDVFVAKDAFGRGIGVHERGWVGIGVGYGLYFSGQMVLAGMGGGEGHLN
ncbi:YhhN-like protein [Aspergillus crustosus]